MADIVNDAGGRACALELPGTGGTSKSTAGGPAPDQVQSIFASIGSNPTGVDQASSPFRPASSSS